MSQDNNENAGKVRARKIVIGVDGSEDAQRAVDWALDQAGPEDHIEIIHTWNQPAAAAGIYGAGYTFDPKPFAEAAEAVLEAEMDRLRDTNRNLDNVTARCVHGHPGTEMLRASEEADLLVVGTRGRGGFVGLLLGSTSTYLAHHAHCPLVIVPSKN